MSGPAAGDRVAIVTGGGTGMGAATASKLVQAGYSVVITGRRRETLERAAASSGAVPFVADIREPASSQAVVAEALRRWGRIDALVLNAGILYEIPFAETTLEIWEDTLRTNLTGPFLLTQAALPALTHRRGAIVGISSVSDAQVWPDTSAYCVSKAGLTMLIKTIAVDFGGRGVRSNVVCPGDIKTEMAVKQVPVYAASTGLDPAAVWDKMVAGVPLRRWGTPEEIADVAVWLLSEAASYVNGATVVVDGGKTQLMTDAHLPPAESVAPA